MSTPAVQLSFTLRTSPNVRTVHLLGSWDNYKSQLPLSVVKDPSAKPGSWKGTFRFQGSHALKLGSRYWYYYIVDGYHVSHDPAKDFITEKTTGRKLNVLDVPGGPSNRDKGATRPTGNADHGPGARNSKEIPQGRALSPGKIQHPKPSKPYASRQLREADYDASPVDDLEERFAGTRLSDAKYSRSPSEWSDESSSSGPAFSRSSPGSSAGSSMSSVSDWSCKCERYGVTRSGQRVKLDCGGTRCGYSTGSSSECSSKSSENSEDSSEDEVQYRARVKAQGTSTGRGGGKSSGARVEVRRPLAVEKTRR